MIIDITGVELTPGMKGEFCNENGLHEGIECCCDECDYMLCCLETADDNMCEGCFDSDCPRSQLYKFEMF